MLRKDHDCLSVNIGVKCCYLCINQAIDWKHAQSAPKSAGIAFPRQLVKNV